MNVASQFSIGLPVSSTYALLVDLDRVAPCLPGAKLGPPADDGSRPLEMTVRLGPMTFRYRGEVAIAERDEAARQAVMRGTAREVKGQGSASSRVAMAVADDGAGGSTVDIEAQVELSGRAAQIGGGMVEAVANRLIEDMVQCLHARFVEDRAAAAGSESTDQSLTAGGAVIRPDDAGEGKPLRAGALLLRVLREKLARLFHRRR